MGTQGTECDTQALEQKRRDEEQSLRELGLSEAEIAAMVAGGAGKPNMGGGHAKEAAGGGASVGGKKKGGAKKGKKGKK